MQIWQKKNNQKIHKPLEREGRRKRDLRWRRAQGELAGEQSQIDVLKVFESIADEKGVEITFAQAAHGQEELRLRPDFLSETEWGPELDNVLHDIVIKFSGNE
ncbi:hypothetical protein C1H46_016363 [Malus baccata]|uniref:Uncharacterized protein n=1 Tax=Malus baccata TaxID=106549 RepID=A0A540MHU2_MALBA|nr:hypothetical protein C1H46_016363 [Malus baccata]